MINRSSKTAWLYIGVVISQLLHSLEEYLTGFYLWMSATTMYFRDSVEFIPVVNLSAGRFLLVNTVIIVTIGLFIPFMFFGKGWAIKAGLLISALELVNGIGHFSMALYLQMYVPGCVTAVGLILFSLMVLSNKLLPSIKLRRA